MRRGKKGEGKEEEEKEKKKNRGGNGESWTPVAIVGSASSFSNLQVRARAENLNSIMIPM